MKQELKSSFNTTGPKPFWHQWLRSILGPDVPTPSPTPFVKPKTPTPPGG